MPSADREKYVMIDILLWVQFHVLGPSLLKKEVLIRGSFKETLSILQTGFQQCKALIVLRITLFCRVILQSYYQ